MIEYLIEREREENFRTSTRTLSFPDGETRRIEAYRLVWTWFDRAVAYEFGPSEEDILTMTLRCADMERRAPDAALGRVLGYLIQRDEAGGMDYTDDNLQLMLAKRGVRRFHERRKCRSPKGRTKP